MDVLTVAGSSPASKFNIFTGILKAEGGDGEPMTLSGIASSTVEDLHGDRIARTAIKEMERQIANGLPIFLNHSYQVPEDVAGYAEMAKARKSGEDADGNAVWDLGIEIHVNDENPRAVESWRGIRKKGAKVGLSIGANIPAGGVEVDRKTGARTINHIDLLETSIVGIPANPRSWIAKALEVLDANDRVVAASEGETELTELVVAPEELKDAPPADDREEDEVEAAADEPETCPDCDDNDIENCNNTRHGRRRKEADDSELEADGDPSPDVSDSDEPEAEEVAPLEGDTDPVAAAIESLDEVEGEVDATHLQAAVDIARALASKLAIVTKERDTALRAREEAERERDKTAQDAQAVLAGTAEIVEKLGNMPIGRKAVFQEQQRSLKHLEETYGADFMNLLEGPDSD